MDISKENVKELTIEELTLCHNEYNKRITNKIKKSSYNKKYYDKIKKTTENIKKTTELIKKTTELDKVDNNDNIVKKEVKDMDIF